MLVGLKINVLSKQTSKNHQMAHNTIIQLIGIDLLQFPTRLIQHNSLELNTIFKIRYVMSTTLLR